MSALQSQWNERDAIITDKNKHFWVGNGLDWTTGFDTKIKIQNTRSGSLAIKWAKNEVRACQVKMNGIEAKGNEVTHEHTIHLDQSCRKTKWQTKWQAPILHASNQCNRLENPKRSIIDVEKGRLLPFRWIQNQKTWDEKRKKKRLLSSQLYCTVSFLFFSFLNVVFISPILLRSNRRRLGGKGRKEKWKRGKGGRDRDARGLREFPK